MEDKKTNGQQAEQPAQGTQEQQAPSAWLERVSNQMSSLGEELNAAKDENRGLIVIAIDHTTPKGSAFVGIAGGSLPLADAMKTVLTSKHFAKHIAHAAQLMAAEAVQTGKGTIVIHASELQEEDEEQEETETQKEGEEAPADE